MNVRIVVTDTDTGTGKSVLSASSANLLGANYWKPVQAGFQGETYPQVVAPLVPLA